VEPEQAQGMFGKRRLSALAAVVALAAVAGALGGALATAGVMHFAGAASTSRAIRSRSFVARIDADILALKAGSSRRPGSAIAGTTSPATASTGSRRRRPSPPPGSPGSAKPLRSSRPRRRCRSQPLRRGKGVTGSIAPRQRRRSLPPFRCPRRSPKWRGLPTVEGWVLREVADGGALIEGRKGIYEVYAGDPVPGLGRVDAIRKQDGRWVVVTSKGLIVAR
jgi:hypothetical protein